MFTTLDPDIQAYVLFSLLSVGIPSTAVAHAFDLDPEYTRSLTSQIRIDRYGSDELGEALTSLIWEAVGATYEELRHGSPASRQRTIAMLLSRSVGIAGRQAPELNAKVREALEELRQAQVVPSTNGDSPEEETFVVGPSG